MDITIAPEPLLLGLCVVAVLGALFISAASYGVYEALLWYQSPRIWVCVSVVRCCLLVMPELFLYSPHRRSASVWA